MSFGILRDSGGFRVRIEKMSHFFNSARNDRWDTLDFYQLAVSDNLEPNIMEESLMKHRIFTKRKPVFFILAGCMIVLAAVCCGESLAESKPIVITVVMDGPLPEAAKKMLEEAYRRLEIPVVFQDIPGERALIMTNNGETDAEMFRVDNMQQNYPNLIQIPVPYITSRNVVFSKDEDFQVRGWESLRPYIIALRIGLKQGEAGTEGMKRYLADGTREAFMMLASGRVQIVFEERLSGLEYIRRLNLKGIRVLEPPLTINPLYHYLHRKHRGLAEKLTPVFQEMRDKGRFQRIYDDVVQKLMGELSEK